MRYRARRMATVRLPDGKATQVELDETDVEADSDAAAITLANEIFMDAMPAVAKMSKQLGEPDAVVGDVEISWTEVVQIGPEPRHKGMEPRRA